MGRQTLRQIAAPTGVEVHRPQRAGPLARRQQPPRPGRVGLKTDGCSGHAPRPRSPPSALYQDHYQNQARLRCEMRLVKPRADVHRHATIELNAEILLYRMSPA
jgi:hypothetical protein